MVRHDLAHKDLSWQVGLLQNSEQQVPDRHPLSISTPMSTLQTTVTAVADHDLALASALIPTHFRIVHTLVLITWVVVVGCQVEDEVAHFHQMGLAATGNLEDQVRNTPSNSHVRRPRNQSMPGLSHQTRAGISCKRRAHH